MITVKELVALCDRLDRLTQDIKELKAARDAIRAQEADYTSKINAKQADRDTVLAALAAAGVPIEP